MNLVERVKAILLQPKSEWPKIEQEPGDPGFLYSNYIAIVSAIPPVCHFIGASIIGFGPFHVGLFGGLIWAVVAYVLGLVGVYVMALIIDVLAGTFGAKRDFGNAMRVAAYAPTAAWVVGVFNLVPLLGILSILGLYSIYLLHTGLVALMRPPADKAVIYTIAVIVAAIVIWAVIAGVPAFLFGRALMGAM
ncbi:MAG TPA: Yip1 family protein [Pseudolabrys sp.]|nr:Yip1 family protein [Pseudolabrys sp.]